MEVVHQRLRSNASRARHLLEITSLPLFLHARFPSVFFELVPLRSTLYSSESKHPNLDTSSSCQMTSFTVSHASCTPCNLPHGGTECTCKIRHLQGPLTHALSYLSFLEGHPEQSLPTFESFLSVWKLKRKFEGSMSVRAQVTNFRFRSSVTSLDVLQLRKNCQRSSRIFSDPRTWLREGVKH
jgi:hypothetical protein